MANIPNIPNIPEVPDGNIPPAVPNGEPKIPDIPAASMSSDNSMKTEEDDGAKWLLLTGDFQKNGAIVSWLDKQDLEKFCTNLETCTLFSLEQRIRNLHPGDNNTYIAILPPDKSEFIYLYKNRRCDLYYYTYDYVYILKDVDEDDWREYAVNYFTNSQLPDFSDSEFIALDKIIEIQQRWNDKLPQEFIDKVLRCVYLFCSPEETEFKIFRFLDKMLQKKDDGNLDRIERQIEKRLKALLKEDLTLSKAQQEILDDIASEMVNILSNTSHQEEKQTFPEIHERWDDKLPKEFIDKVLSNINLFCSPEETEFKIFRFLDKMLQKNDDDYLDGIERKIEKRLKALLKEDLTLSKAQQEILDDIANDMVSILKDSYHEEENKQESSDIDEIGRRMEEMELEWNRTVDNILNNSSERAQQFEQFADKVKQSIKQDSSERDVIGRKIAEMKAEVKNLRIDNYGELLKWRKEKLEAVKDAQAHKNDSPEANQLNRKLLKEYEEIKNAIKGGAVSIDEVEKAIRKNQKGDHTVQIDTKETESFTEVHERWDDKIPKEFIDKVLSNVNLFCSLEETEFKIFRFLDKMLQKKDDDYLDGIERKIEKRLKALLKEDLTLSKAQQEILDDIANEMVNILSNTSHQEEKQTFPEIHERWDDKLPKEFIDKVLSNVNLFCSPEETEFKVFRYLDKMQNKDEIDLEGIDRIIKKRLNSLLAENIELSSSQQVALDDIANDMVNLVIGFSKKKNNPQPEQTRVIDKEEKSDTGRNDNIETVTPPRKERDVNKLDTTYNIKTNRYKRIGIGIICIFVIYILFSWVFSKDNSENDNPNEELISVADPSIRIDPSRDVEEQLSEYYSLVSDAGDGFFKIMQIDNDDDENIKYGLASVSGVVVCKPMFDYIYSIGNGFFVVEKDGQKGCISTDGKLVVKPEYDLVYDMVDDTFDKETGLIKVKKNDKQGLVNIHTSKEVAPCIYSDIGSLEGGLYKVSIDGKVGYLNKDGSVFKQPE